MKHLLIRIITLALVLSLLTGIAAAAEEKEKSATIGVTSTITTLNPLAMDATEIVKYATSLVFLPLVELNRELEFVPQLAESITSNDNLHFTIKLREDAVWSDGQPVTSEDVAFTLALSADPVCASIALVMYALEGTNDDGLIESGAEEISGVQIVDEHTLVVTAKWNMDLYSFENNIGRYLLTLPKHVLKDVNRADLLTLDWFYHPDVISGPYFIQDYDLDHYVHYVANENYFQGAPNIKYLNIQVVTSSQILAGLKSGEIDLVQQTMASIPVEDYDAVRSLNGITAVQGSAITNESIFFNTQNVTDARIRQAILYGMDRETILNGLIGSNGEIVDGFLVTSSPFYSEELGVTAYDPDKAAALIAEAKADGAHTEYTWYVNSAEGTWNQAVEYFAATLEELGLSIKIRSMDLAALMDAAFSGEFEIMSVEYTYVPVAPYTDVSWLLGDVGWTHYLSVPNEAVEDALLATQTETEPDAIVAQWLTIDQAMVNDAPMISGYVLSSLGAVSNRLLNAVPDVFGTFVNVHQWDVQ